MLGVMDICQLRCLQDFAHNRKFYREHYIRITIGYSMWNKIPASQFTRADIAALAIAIEDLLLLIFY